MRKLATLAILVFAVGSIGAVASGAGKQQRVKSKVTVKATGGDPATGLKGKAKARRNGHKVKKCVKKRRVTVRHAGEKVGADKTNRKGKWSIDVDAYSEPGKYKAKMRRKNPRGPITCTAARRSITL